MSWLFSPFFLESELLKVDKILGLTFLRQEKTWKDLIRRFSIYYSWVLCSMDCLQLPCVRVEEAFSWTQRFLRRTFWLKNRSLFMKNKFKRKCLQKFYISSKQEKEWYRKTTSYLEQPSHHFCQHFMRTTTQQTVLAINLASQQKTRKLYFSSQERKQFKLLAVPFKPLRCCLNCHVWKFCKDLFLNLRLIWSVNQIVLFNSWVYARAYHRTTSYCRDRDIQMSHSLTRSRCTS